MPTIRVEKTEQYSVISNSLLCDSRLSWAARGLAAYLLSKPDNWQISTAHLIEQSPAGRDATQTIINDLKKHGYLTRTQYRKDDGTFAYHDVLKESPVDTVTGKSVDGTVTGLSVNGKPVDIVSTDLINTDPPLHPPQESEKKKPDPLGDEVEEMIKTYNSLFFKKPEITERSKAMRNKIKGRLKEDGQLRERWREALAMAAELMCFQDRDSFFNLNWFVGKGKSGNLPGFERVLSEEFLWKEKQYKEATKTKVSTDAEHGWTEQVMPYLTGKSGADSIKGRVREALKAIGGSSVKNVRPEHLHIYKKRFVAAWREVA